MPVNYSAPIEIRDHRNGNWFWIQTHVWRDSRLSLSDKSVYGTLASYCNQKQQSFPSVETISRDSGVSERHVYRCLKELEGFGYVSVTRQTGKPNLYTLIHTTPDIMSPLTTSHPTPDKSTLGTPDKSTLLTITTEQELINKREQSPSFLSNLSSDDVQALVGKFPKLTEATIKFEAEKAQDWLSSKGRVLRDYRAFLRNWLRRLPEVSETTANPAILSDDDLFMAQVVEQARR